VNQLRPGYFPRYVASHRHSYILNYIKQNDDPKKLEITIPYSIFANDDGFRIGIFPVGTSAAQAQTDTGIIAGVERSSPGWSRFGINLVTLTVPLYNIINGNHWTGHGIYDIYITLSGNSDRHYKAGSVYITSEITKMQISNINEIF